jgi:hypothetical protein
MVEIVCGIQFLEFKYDVAAATAAFGNRTGSRAMAYQICYASQMCRLYIHIRHCRRPLETLYRGLTGDSRTSDRGCHPMAARPQSLALREWILNSKASAFSTLALGGILKITFSFLFLAFAFYF